MNLENIDISKLPPDIRKKFLQLRVMHAEKKIQNKAKEDFLSFVKCVWPEFIEGAHHRHIAKKFNDLATGKINRLIVNMPPRHTKSEFASYLLPAWMVGRNPKLKIIQAAQGGEYFAAGVGGAITGRGADLLIIDDPHSEQDAMSSTAMENAYEWYTSGPRQRLQPGGKIILVMTRWSKKDLTGILLANQKEVKADQWEVVEFPAILDDGPKTEAVWPEYWNIDELEKVKATLPVGKWNAQWMQRPTSEEGALIKREWWRLWDHDEPPNLHYVIQSYDTAYLKKETADFSAITTWGVFYPDEDSPANLILVDAIKGRYEFPELRRIALDQYKYWNPESVIIEAKAAGLPLTYELRQMDIPVQNFTPSKGNDKHVRVNTCAPLFESGMIWAPDQKFADEVIEECAAFPHGDHDDLVDSTTQAVMRFRQGGFVQHPEDYVMEKRAPRKFEYY
jgi:predicted phage terminase large subunit-like protein